MDNNTLERRSIWNDAARSGLVLGLVAIVYMVVSTLMSRIQASGAGAAVLNVSGIILWVAKIYLCIYLMKVFMTRFASRYDEVTNADSFRFGMYTALLSALLYSGFYLAWVLFIQPDMFQESIDAAMQMYENIFTESQLEQMEQLVPKMPSMSFFFNLVWCWLFGTVVAAILSRNIPPRNPFFEDSGSDQQ